LIELIFKNIEVKNNFTSAILLDSALIKNYNDLNETIGCLDFRIRFKYPLELT